MIVEGGIRVVETHRGAWNWSKGCHTNDIDVKETIQQLDIAYWVSKWVSVVVVMPARHISSAQGTKTCFFDNLLTMSIIILKITFQNQKPTTTSKGA